MIDEDILKDFLVEAKDGIRKMEEEFIELERDKGNLEILKSLFRTMHSLKGAAGFFGFKSLEGIAHFAEDILSKLRDGLIEVDEEIVDILLKCLDEIKFIVAHIEENKVEPIDDRILDFLVDLSNFNERLKKKVQGELEIKEGIAKEETIVRPSQTEKVEEAKPQEIIEHAIKPSLDIQKEEQKEELKEEKVISAPTVKELTETHIKVDIKLLDSLMNLAGELVLARNRVVQLANKLNDPDLTRSVQVLSMVTTELQETIMKTRMQPIGVVFNKFPRIVRDLSRSLNKRVNLHLEGTETELDRSIIEAIKDPLTHLVRNSIDHGIEPPEIRVQMGKPPEGNLFLRAYHEGGQVVIEIEDDGRGIDLEKIKKKALEKGLVSPEEIQYLSEKEILSFIFKSGFSTAEKVTQISGRGVGMDVVKTNIEKLGGSIEINTLSGKGTTVRVKIPLTLAIIPALIVTSMDQRYAIPQVNLKEIVSINPQKDILYLGESQFYRLRGEIIPILSLSSILAQQNTKREHNLLILTTGEREYGLLVDRIYDSEEIVVKPLGKWFKGIPLYSGATIMGDGRLALILDVVGLSRFVGLRAEEVERAFEEKKLKTIAEETQFILLFDIEDSTFALPLALISRLDKVKAKEIQIIGGKEVFLYKNKVIPIIRLENYLPIQAVSPQDEYSVLFFSEREKTCAILCSRIVDTIETSLQVETDLYVQPGILGHRIINNRTVLFLDIYKIIEMYDPEWFKVKRYEVEETINILLAEDSPFFQNMVSNYLKQAGFNVEIAPNGQEALNKLKAGYKPDLIISDLEMPVMDGFEFIKEVRNIPEYKDIPILVLTSLTGEDIRKRVLELGANGYEVKLERERVLLAIENFLATKKKKVSVF
ncbi:MAG: chemotaxis protein CheW [Caldimicrobium sp.]|nr:chemotaxis protein CheW [Caldimicrobium sp.]MCX7874114.1 chemotaxis protein CheW [Caldimicrobium sp.]MDW8093751.1 chemotaxis protein CheW [Caldimicrobium sp.]